MSLLLCERESKRASVARTCHGLHGLHRTNYTEVMDCRGLHGLHRTTSHYGLQRTAWTAMALVSRLTGVGARGLAKSSKSEQSEQSGAAAG